MFSVITIYACLYNAFYRNQIVSYKYIYLYFSKKDRPIIANIHDHNTRAHSNFALHIPMTSSNDVKRYDMIPYVFNQFFRTHTQLCNDHKHHSKGL